jgi:hypothetical protein
MHEEGGKPFHMAATPGVAHVVQVSALGQRQDQGPFITGKTIQPKTILFSNSLAKSHY